MLDRAYAGFAAAHAVGGFETMSAGKTWTAGLIGAAVNRGLFDLDTPIQAYGVRPNANWSRAGTDFFPDLTARHLITQTMQRCWAVSSWSELDVRFGLVYPAPVVLAQSDCWEQPYRPTMGN